jgi:hypothetical protein
VRSGSDHCILGEADGHLQLVAILAAVPVDSDSSPEQRSISCQRAENTSRYYMYLLCGERNGIALVFSKRACRFFNHIAHQRQEQFAIALSQAISLAQAVIG